MRSHDPDGATAEGLVGHQKNAVFDRELVEFMLREVSIREVSHAVPQCNIRRLVLTDVFQLG